MIDDTHDMSASCWVPGADQHADFPVQNLAMGIFSTRDAGPRPGIAIGDHVLDVGQVLTLLQDRAAEACNALHAADRLNALFALPAEARRAFRRAVFDLLSDAAWEKEASGALVPADVCTMHLPLAVRDYTDFYAGIHHATTVGSLLRPENPLLPNYKFIPVGYHGRSSSIRVSGTSVRRPSGQVKPAGADEPVFAQSQRLDYELELGIWVGGQSQLGTPVPIASARDHIAGVSLLNDWSARDIQAWEYVPLGPFLAKNFATTVAPWVVTAEALEPFRTSQHPRLQGDPAPLEYLSDKDDQAHGAFDIRVDVLLRSAKMRQAGDDAVLLGSVSATDLYWTPAQMLAHHTVNGCDIAAGDLMGTGTISGAEDSQRGSLMELSRGGRNPITLPNGESRTFLADGDEVIMMGWAEREGFRRIGFGQCAAIIAPA